MRPRLDGGTSFALDLTADELENLPEPFAAVVEEARRVRSRDEARGRKKLVTLPMPQLDLFERPVAMATARGERRQQVAFYVEDVVYIGLDLERSPRPKSEGFAGRVTVEFKARVLHTEMDQRPIVARWLHAVHWMVTGDGSLTGRWLDADGCSDFRHHGWRGIGAEVCSDFWNMPWMRTDVDNFVIPRGTMTRGDERLRQRVQGKRAGFAETVALGTRKSNLSLCLYDKAQQLDDVKGGDDSAYRHIWEANGLVGKSDKVSRVELRPRGRGLVLEDEDTGESFDMSDPMVMADPKMLAMFWRSKTHGLRLVVPGTATLPKNCKVDERWSHVRGAVDAPLRRLKQAREAQKNAHAEAAARARHGMFLHARRYSALTNRELVSEQGYENCMRIAIADEVQSIANDKLAEMGIESMLPAERDAAAQREIRLARESFLEDGQQYCRDYRSLRLPFMGVEILEAEGDIEFAELAGFSVEGMPSQGRSASAVEMIRKGQASFSDGRPIRVKPRSPISERANLSAGDLTDGAA